MNSIAVDPLTRPPDADVVLPGSKSITNRALVAAALAPGRSLLSGALFAEDTLAMVDCLRSLGAMIETDRASASVTVVGFGSDAATPSEPLWVRQSGTTARFLLPIAALAPDGAVVDGDDQIRTRPQGDLLLALAALGGRIEELGEPGRLPARVHGPLTGTSVRVLGDTSSQFVSALLLTAPALGHELVVEVVGPVVSLPYLEMTVAVMRSFGADVAIDHTPDGGHVFTVADTSYRATTYAIEPDASAASYFFAAAAVSEGRAAVEGLGSASLQGDAKFVELLAEMGADVIQTATRTEVHGTGRFVGVDADMAQISDTVPTLAAIAPLAATAVRVRNVGFIRAKESDRIAGPVAELRRLGIDAVEHEDGFEVQPGTPTGGLVETYDDHRMAMAFTVLGLMHPGISIADPACVAKTFPDFFDAVDQLHAAGDAELPILAIDGPAGSGKSTVAKAVAERLGRAYLDTGAMYRSVTLAALDQGLAVDDAVSVSALARVLDIDVGLDRVLIGGIDATERIRSAEVNANVSIVAAHPGVRASMRRQQRAWARRRGGGVLEGRDIGSVVFPRARLKVYVTASAPERARRRSVQSGRTYDEILAELDGRDRLDSGRIDSPLVEADDAVVLDTTGMSIDEVIAAVAQLFITRSAETDEPGEPR